MQARSALVAVITCALLACGQPPAGDASTDATDATRVDTSADTPADAGDARSLDIVDVALDVIHICTADYECADGLFCDGIERCNPGAPGADLHGCTAPAAPACPSPLTCAEATRSCDVPCPAGPCTGDPDCDDHVACNGAETCVMGSCRSTPLTCPSGQICDEARGGCIPYCNCDDHLWCTGVEICTAGVCGPAASIPCATTAGCDEATHHCIACTTNAQCDDGLYCNGIEVCGPANTCIRGLVVPCTGRVCLEALRRCGCTATSCSDGIFCNGAETCGTDGMCHPAPAPCPTYQPGTTALACHEDTDRCDSPIRACVMNPDCSDSIFCNGIEVCMPGALGANAYGCVPGGPACAVNQTCDETMDRCVTNCPDGDGDGHRPVTCGGDDCDDADPLRFPGNPEVCGLAGDLHDEDCDPSTVGQLAMNDADHDGYLIPTCCNPRVGMPPVCGDDCDDSRADVHPHAAEICDERDNNCDGSVDEGATVTAYLDHDQDGFGTAACARQVCPGTFGFVGNRNDCNDGDPAVTPSAQQCGSGTNGTEIWLCGPGGTWMQSACTGGMHCVSQPNGLGACR